MSMSHQHSDACCRYRLPIGQRVTANPNIEAARESVDLADVTQLLWRIMELMGVPVAESPERDRTGFAMWIRDAIVNQELFAAALTPGEPQ